jgi:hypothetical protein
MSTDVRRWRGNRPLGGNNECCYLWVFQEHCGRGWTLWTGMNIMDGDEHYGRGSTLWTGMNIMDGDEHYGRGWTLWTGINIVDRDEHCGRGWTLWTGMNIMDGDEHCGRGWTLWTGMNIMDGDEHYGRGWTLWTGMNIMDGDGMGISVGLWFWRFRVQVIVSCFWDSFKHIPNIYLYLNIFEFMPNLKNLELMPELNLNLKFDVWNNLNFTFEKHVWNG